MEARNKKIMLTDNENRTEIPEIVCNRNTILQEEEGEKKSSVVKLNFVIRLPKYVRKAKRGTIVMRKVGSAPMRDAVLY